MEDVEVMDFLPEKAMDFVPEKGFYQPSNDRTWESYQALYWLVDQQLRGFPQTVVCGVADEILGIFRNRYLTQIQKQFEVEKLIGSVSIDVFNQLVLSTNEIDDYNRAKQEEAQAYFYQPRSTVTWRAYNELMSAVVAMCGVQQPYLVLCCAANELIAVLKNVNIQELQWKKRVIRDILNLGYVTDQLVNDLVAIVDLITDYKPDEYVGPTDLMSEDTLMMMIGMERKVKRKRFAYEEENIEEGMWEKSPWSDDDEEKPMVGDGSSNVVGPPPIIKDDDDDQKAQNENMGPVVEYHLVKDVKEKLVLEEVVSSEEDEEDGGWVLKNVMQKVKSQLVLNEVKEEEQSSSEDDGWVKKVKNLVLNEVKEEEGQCSSEDEWVVL